ncbi:class I mannose-6-phosphate isomerase [Qipengyuania sp. XHP0207]|uniref:class I mannose-6-phosphate isomerase n=1 Tax=Qipengyuania sp. XHP0207 TaxID=3038078 RepID=UPI00241CA8AF|nr:class I mannose-6-phosphate isomerase [Qipengyuania sp. XHP0207]MDG5747285.1 class I mannose-6-phosphate isomerase [Qipengyuania sp. XHP0207]
MIRKLPQRFVEKIWGVERLPSFFAHAPQSRIGEIWFEPPPELDALLVKYIFTSERLSVQAHPNDQQVRSMGLGKTGKSECWVIIDAEPGAEIAAGFENKVDPDGMRRSALDGSILDLLSWHRVEAGDVFYIPAGTVHAIGAGVSLIEVQQNSDITFRLYDYGRPRELHLDQGMQVASGLPYPEQLKSRVTNAAGPVVKSPHFTLYLWKKDTSPFPSPLHEGPALVIPYGGEIHLAGETLKPGECALALSSHDQSLSGEGSALIAQAVDPISGNVG